MARHIHISLDEVKGIALFELSNFGDLGRLSRVIKG
jgi:hypothetical protein